MDARVQVYSDKMQKAYEFLEADFAAIRAGRANPHVLDKLRVDYYGTPTPIQQVGNVTVPEARIIQIAPWEVFFAYTMSQVLICACTRICIAVWRCAFP